MSITGSCYRKITKIWTLGYRVPSLYYRLGVGTLDSLVIRQSTIRDAQGISDVLTASQWFTYRNLFSEDYIQELIEQYYNLQRIELEILSIDKKWHGYLIAELGNTIIGVIGGGMLNVDSGEVYVFYLDPDMRGAGIGTRLLNFFTKIQKHKYGAKEQWVAVAKGNNYAIPFYEARGFIFQSEIQSYGSTEKDNDISLMYKRKI